jgi:hypothetical protein
MVAEVKTTAMTLYERIPDPVNAIQLMGSDIAKSGLFNCGSLEQGRVLALECFARGVPPLTLAETYHIIDNKLSMKADKMLARFEEFGGKYKVVSRTPDLAAIEVTIGGQTNKFSLSWEEAQQEPFVYLASGQKPKFKTKYATPRSRTQMLWARVVSDSVRAVCPRANSGTYTPEEIDDFQGAEARSNGNGHGKPATTSVVDQAAAAAGVAAANGGTGGTVDMGAGEVVDAEFEVKKDEPAKAETPPAATTATTTTTQDSPELATEYQIARIKELSVLLKCGEKVEAACQKRGCNSVRSLRKEDAGEMLDKLEANFAAKKAAETPPVDATEVKPAETPPCGPMADRQYEAIDKALKEFAQHDKSGYDAFMVNLKAYLASKSIKFRQLDANQAAQLYDSIRQKSLPTFITASLEGYQGSPGK